MAMVFRNLVYLHTYFFGSREENIMREIQKYFPNTFGSGKIHGWV